MVRRHTAAPKLEFAQTLFSSGRFNEAIEAIVGPMGLDLDFFGTFFPADDGRQDLVDWIVVRARALGRHHAAYAKAKAALRQRLGPASSSGVGAALVAYCDIVLGKHDSAVASARRAVETSPSSFWTHFMEAVSLRLKAASERSRDPLPETLASINRALAHESDNVYGYLVRAYVRREFEDQKGRLDDAESILRLRPDFVWARVEKAEILGESNRTRAAMRELDRLVAAHPREGWAWAHRARVLAICGLQKQSLADFDKAVRLDPRSGGIRAWRGEARRRLGDYAGASRDLDAAVRLDPTYRLAYSWRGRVRLLRGEYEKAVADFDLALAREPLEDFAAGWRAEALWKSGACEKAARGFEAIHPAEPMMAWNLRVEQGEAQELGFFKGLDRARRERDARFWKDLDEVVAARPADAWALAFRGRCRLSYGDGRAGVEDLGRAIAAAPRAAYAWRWRGEGRRRLGDLHGALSDLDRALALAPRDRWASASRALTRAALGDDRGAEKDFAAALIRREQRFALVYQWRAAWLASRGRRDEARQDARIALTLDGKDERAAVLSASLA